MRWLGTDEFVHERDEAVKVLLGREEEVILPFLLDYKGRARVSRHGCV